MNIPKKRLENRASELAGMIREHLHRYELNIPGVIFDDFGAAVPELIRFETSTSDDPEPVAVDDQRKVVSRRIEVTPQVRPIIDIQTTLTLDLTALEYWTTPPRDVLDRVLETANLRAVEQSWLQPTDSAVKTSWPTGTRFIITNQATATKASQAVEGPPKGSDIVVVPDDWFMTPEQVNAIAITTNSLLIRRIQPCEVDWNGNKSSEVVFRLSQWFYVDDQAIKEHAHRLLIPLNE